jgi:hypothetical protein
MKTAPSMHSHILEAYQNVMEWSIQSLTNMSINDSEIENKKGIAMFNRNPFLTGA